MSIQSGNRSITLVTTDLFISAAAALLIIISMSKPVTPKPIPVQADIVAFCPPADLVQSDVKSGLTLKSPTHIETDQTVSVSVTSGTDLLSLDKVLGLPPKLFYTVALAGDEDSNGPVSADCYKNARDNIFKQRLNSPRSDDDSNKLSLAQFGLVITPSGTND